MISKNQIKLILSLNQKKHRQNQQLFFAEGKKVINEFLNSNFELQYLYTIQNDFDTVKDSLKIIITELELKKISALTTPNGSLAVFKIPNKKQIVPKGLVVALENIRDPGNLGTILRLCDWFGVSQIYCSPQSVDLYNPKVVQASMGSIARVNVNYVDLNHLISNTKLPVFGTFMNGENIYKINLPNEGIVIFGNEANGISDELEQIIQNKISIPRFGDLQKTESLNVATAVAITLSEFKRQF